MSEQSSRRDALKVLGVVGAIVLVPQVVATVVAVVRRAKACAGIA